MKQDARAEEDCAAVTLALRGERVPLRNAVASVYNRARRELLVASAPTLYLYGKLLAAGGDLLGVLAAEENVHFQFVLQIPWLEVYSVIVADVKGKLEHRIVSADLKTSLTSHILIEKGGQFFTALSNPHRREVITADSDGGLKVWTLRVISTAHNNGGLKGILRLHTAATAVRKPYYRHLHLSFDSQRIFAATSTRVYVFDAASYHRLPCCLHEEQLTISSMKCSSGDNSVFLTFKETPRKIFKYLFVLRKKGPPQFRKTGDYEHYEDCAMFHESYQRPLDDSVGPLALTKQSDGARGVVLVDICAKLTVTDFSTSRGENNEKHSDANDTEKHPVVALPFHPPSERYQALHTDMVRGDRDLVFVVWSTGFCILEIFFPNAQGRLVCSMFDGEYLKRLNAEARGPLSIFECVPSPRMILFEESRTDFRVAPVRMPAVSDVIENGVVELCVVDYLLLDDAMVVLWSNGMVERYNLYDNRVFTITAPFDRAAKASAMVISPFEGENHVVIGDSTGAIRLFPVRSNDSAPNVLMTRRDAHTESVSALFDLSGRETDQGSCLSLLSIDRTGDVKKWAVRRSPVELPQETFTWEILVCFRTYSSDLSTAIFEFPDFLFCGFDGGGVECWRLPSASPKPSSQTSRLQHNPNHRITVVRRPLHSIDLHLTPVLCILSEPGAGEAVAATSQSVPDNFSWVFSYDEDAIILVWCFSVDFFFPHRRIQVNDFVKGIYVTPRVGLLEVFAYIDQCVERLDLLSPSDKDAARERLQRGRALSAQRLLESQAAPGSQDVAVDAQSSSGWSNQGGFALALGSHFPEGASITVPAVPSVRISITLPAVEKKAKPAKPSAGATSPAKATAEMVEALLIKDQEGEPESNSISDIAIVSPDSHASLVHDSDSKPSKTKAKALPAQRKIARSPRRKVRGRKKLRSDKGRRSDIAEFLPGKNSLPSSFRHAQPRVYRTSVNPLESLPSQPRCAVVTAGGQSSSDEDDIGPVWFEHLSAPRKPTKVQISSALDQGQQEKVSVVSLAEYEDESILLLDFRPGSRRFRTRRSTKVIRTDSPEQRKSSFELPFLSWEGLSERERRIELMAASKSRCVQEDAEDEGVFVPPVQDFESPEVSVQMGVRSFTRWFIATHRHRQRIRERFLLEEMLFAAIDPAVHHKLAEAGRSPPPPEQVGSPNAIAWQEFTSWYSLGRITTQQVRAEEQSAQRERLRARTEYLELRLRIVAQAELEVQQEEEEAGPCEEECEPPQRVFIFEHFVKKILTDKNSPSSWENTSLDNRMKEITLALMDPNVQVAALRNEIELPDLSGASLEDFDIFSLAGKFVPWWKASRNIHRRDFLQREVTEASQNKAILELLAQERAAAGEDGLVSMDTTKAFLDAYFKSDTARHTFLKKKLFYLKRKSRIASVARYRKLPAPLVWETLPLPLAVTFEFVEKSYVEEEEVPLIEIVEEEILEEVEEVVEEEPVVEIIDTDGETEEEERRRLEEENAQILLELIYMAREDAISREYNCGSDESEDEIEEETLSLPKRTDFSCSYFFGNLPVHYRMLASCGWRAGSGVDNGDEEMEEEEKLERERERQRLLDEQEAERILEAERQAEKARLEKEREEKAFQFRRVRQAELKKVLAHQADLESQRKLEQDNARLALERQTMLQEDESARWQRDQLVYNCREMLLEDQLASCWRKEIHEAAVARLRQLLHEQASMSVEDQRSALVGAELRQREHQRVTRVAFLSELYTPFHPAFPSSSVGSESFLPMIQQRLELQQQRRMPVKSAGIYAIPAAEAMILDDVDQDAYLARDSRKFKLLMGLPLRTPHTHKRPRIPTEQAIISMQKQRQGLQVDEERLEVSSDDRKVILPLSKAALRSRSRQRDRAHNHLPDIMPRQSSKEQLTDLDEAFRKQTAATPTKRQPLSVKNKQQSKQNQQNQQTHSLPFFRGNMVVRGQSQARSRDYTY